MKCSDVIDKLEIHSPSSFAESYDNVGLIIGSREKEIKSILIALDATKKVIDEAVNLGVDMILTHHPIIFRPMKQICTEHFIGEKAIALIKNDICCYAMHTNFDIMGMADAAADEIGLNDRQVLYVTYEDDIAKEGIGRYGNLSVAMNLKQCAYHVKKVFKLDHTS